MDSQRRERARELERKYQARKGHVPQISISDDSHHVTEAIGDMYGRDRSDSDPKRHSRPLSFISSTQVEGAENFHTFGFEQQRNPQDDSQPSSSKQESWFPPASGGSSSDKQGRTPLGRTTSNERTPTSPTNPNHGSEEYHIPPRSSSFTADRRPASPPGVHRSASETATTGFPLNDIDYESSPAAVAQELSNLQAIRRMSMDVNAMDPDLPSFNSGFKMPASQGDDEQDPSHMFWVPARVHPELAPKEFKDFIDDRVKTLKRRSGDENEALLPPSLDRAGSAGGLRRKKSMLSRQIDSGSGYQDGAERLLRKRSLASQRHPDSGVNLSTLEELVSDPETTPKRRSLEDNRQSMESISDAGSTPEDMPVLAAKPVGSLKRSTRTTYRRGSLKKGERVPFSKRIASRHGEPEREESPVSSPIVGRDEIPEMPLIPELPDFKEFKFSRSQTEPISSSKPIENFSRPSRRAMSPPLPSTSPSPPPEHSAFSDIGHITHDQKQEQTQSDPSLQQRRTSPPQRAFHSRIASNGRTSAQLPGYNVPDIVETPPPESEVVPQQQFHLPERKSSHEPPPSKPPQAPLPNRPSQQRAPPGPPTQRSQKAHNQTLDEMSSHPSPLPGNSTRTDSLSFIPTVEEKKSEKKGKDKREVSDGSGKKSWWSFGGDDKSKDKDKSKSKLSKPGNKDDSTRLDVLQSSIDSRGSAVPPGRESLVLDRDSVKLDEARKETNRKASSEPTKKEKDSSLFSSLFGGSKKNKSSGADSSSKSKQSASRGLSPDPTPRILRPDIDYNWTRFSILEERAIYRMAHIKLANPRRELYSQVLLSNFMYSYLAKVQQMHPQIQIPQSAAQKQAQRQQQEAAKKQKEKEEREALMKKREEEEREREREREQREREQMEREQREQELKEREQMELEQREQERRAEEERMFAGFREQQATAALPSPPLNGPKSPTYAEYDLSNEPPPDEDRYATPSRHDSRGSSKHTQPYASNHTQFDRNGSHKSNTNAYQHYQPPNAHHQQHQHQQYHQYHQQNPYAYDRSEQSGGANQGYGNGMKQNGYTVGGSERYLGTAGPGSYGGQGGAVGGANGQGYNAHGQREAPYLQLKHESVQERGQGRFWGEGLD
ncbi:hypothetical protein P152DRAFT_150200 [Eremomyces bilateralis CBS 781.70]|uniref:Protein Zds1 C-terminal domain-containing protein n=1 Tax=Eremomyces bilateralis CBS 781.70 TaxID=1392243 RepID=A0A6G1FVK4_9PEZI|nr:uncharacterized protein P152DRAFT_150200 [Eremomyces bilateralis CBS 781.70]KAF1809803.1 hypothetical protein P152DRAFT_150200 [Eremomyces bilateralis CBS 781.70]